MIPCASWAGPAGWRDRYALGRRLAKFRYCLAWLAGLFLIFPATDCAGVEILPLQSKSTEMIDRNTYDQAIQSIPFDRLTDDAQARIWRIVSQPSIYRRLPVTRLQSDKDMYLFLVRHPEILVNMWELMGVTRVNIRRTGDFTFDANDGAGTTGMGELIYGDKETHLVLGEGAYEGSVLKRKIHGRCLVVLKSGYSPNVAEKTQVTHRLDMFVQLDNVGAELVVKTLQPLVGKSADHNFVETSRFLGQISQAAETRPTGMQQLAGRLTKVDPTVRDRFATLSAAIYARASEGATIPTSALPPMPAAQSDPGR
jgi:hypothetical protein